MVCFPGKTDNLKVVNSVVSIKDGLDFKLPLEKAGPSLFRPSGDLESYSTLDSKGYVTSGCRSQPSQTSGSAFLQGKGEEKEHPQGEFGLQAPISSSLFRLHLGLLSLGQSGVPEDQDSPSPSTPMPRRCTEGWESDKHWKGRLPPSPGRSLRPVSAGARSPPTFHLPCSLWGKERSAAAAPPLASWRTAAPLKHIQVCTPPSRGGLHPYLGTQEQE